MARTTRRDFFKLAGLGFAAGSFSSLRGASSLRGRQDIKHKKIPFSLGMASYTLREFSLEDTLAMTKTLGLKKIALKSFHLPLESSDEEIRTATAKVKHAGLDLYGCGVVYMKNREEVENAFRYAKAAGMKVIIGVPNHELLGLVNDKVQESGIKVAIHNHGPGDLLYPVPQAAYDKIKGMDSRLGICLDIGHTVRAGVDPSETAEEVSDRLIDVHLKDVTAASAEGGPVEVGQGVIDIPGFLRTLIDLNYTGVAAFEYEKDANNPLPGLWYSLGYITGALSVLKRL